MKKLVYLFIFLVILNCKDEKISKFSFSGITNSIPDGSILLLDNIYENKVLDSATVMNNKFEFTSVLPSSPLRVVLRTKKFSHYKYIWLENNKMTFDASQEDFKNATVTGSESENLSQKLNKLTSVVEPHSEAQRKIEQKFVSDNPNSIVSASILSIYSTTWGKEVTQNLFNKFSLENKNSEFGKRISHYIKLVREPKIGESYVDFEMVNLNGNIVKLSDNDRKIILLEFWASWCGPCRKENPNLVKTYEKYNSKGFEVFAVSLDNNKESWEKAVKNDSLNWQHVSELNGDDNTAGLIYGVSGIPDNFLIDKNGIIVGRNLRGERLNEKLQELTKI
ncbi:redoxin domain-containing protein [Winogradskyella sp. R77965]|uniref:redoxin domain-containing protein n=1 Tax=Winogradskyella sp. R77965 TaxID=3093872 RepID=UPI0037DDA21A